MDPQDKREVSLVSGSCQVNILICEMRDSCLHDSTADGQAGRTAGDELQRDKRHLGHKVLEDEEFPGIRTS